MPDDECMMDGKINVIMILLSCLCRCIQRLSDNWTIIMKTKSPKTLRPFSDLFPTLPDRLSTLRFRVRSKSGGVIT